MLNKCLTNGIKKEGKTTLNVIIHDIMQPSTTLIPYPGYGKCI